MWNQISAPPVRRGWPLLATVALLALLTGPALPGTSFVVNGVAVPANSALASLGAELHLTPRWTMIGKFDGEFASSAQTYAGSGTLRYAWRG